MWMAACASDPEFAFNVRLSGPETADHLVLADGVAIAPGEHIEVIFESYQQAKQRGILFEAIETATGQATDSLRMVPPCDCCLREGGGVPLRASDAIRHEDGRLERIGLQFTCKFDSWTCSS